MIPNLEPLEVTGDEPVPLVDPELLLSPFPGANAFASLSGYSLLVITDGECHFGNEDMTRENTCAMPAGTYPMTLQDGEVPYVLAPEEATVNIKRIGQGFKVDGVNEAEGFGEGGFGEGGFGE